MKKYVNYCKDYKDFDENKDNIFEKYSEKNIIVYGKNCLNNYVFSLINLKHLSKSELKYSRRIAINYKSEDIFFNISDIHFEIDLDLLGVNQYNIFLTVFQHIKENMIFGKKCFYVMCLNFQEIKSELMNIFYTFMNEHNIYFIILTNEISFICENVFQNSVIKKIKGKPSHKNNSQEEQINIITKIITQDNISLFNLREQLYIFLTFNYKIQECFPYIIFNLIEKQYLNEENINDVLKNYNQFIEKYNNNYRPIYHLEMFILFLINLKVK